MEDYVSEGDTMADLVRVRAGMRTRALSGLKGIGRLFRDEVDNMTDLVRLKGIR